jgi:hypothetical protein
MAILNKGLQFLINSFQRENIRLYEILNELNGQQTQIIAQGNQSETVLSNYEFRFNLPGVQAVASDVYPTWKQVRLPLDDSNNVVGTGITVRQLWLSCKVAPVASNYSLDLLVSKDNGVTWNSILAPTNALKLVIPIGVHVIKYGGVLMSNNVLQNGWLLRLDVKVADGTVEAVELLILGVLSF